MTNIREVTISVGKDSTYPGSSESASVPVSFVLGQGWFNVKASVEGPTPAEARAMASSPKRMAKPTAELKNKKRAPESPKPDQEERKSVFPRPSYVTSRAKVQSAVSVPPQGQFCEGSDAGPSGTKLSRRQRRNRNKQLYKMTEVQKETSSGTKLSRRQRRNRNKQLYKKTEVQKETPSL